jgi:hypothetical protein
MAGATYASWSSDFLPASVAVARGDKLVRLVTSFATTDSDLEKFVGIARGT